MIEENHKIAFPLAKFLINFRIDFHFQTSSNLFLSVLLGKCES